MPLATIYRGLHRVLPKSRSTMTALWLVASCLLMAIVFAWLHAPWAPGPWFACMALALAFFHQTPERGAGSADRREGRSGSLASLGFGCSLALVVAVAAFMRLYRIHELPLGPYVDEIQTLRNALALSSLPFDFFGSRPLARDGWVNTSHVYLYFDWLILKTFGVSYLSMKLFSVIPGVLTCVFFALICGRLFAPRIALVAALFFAVGHWPVRLSRYGWDAAFAVMAFAAALWLLLLARERRQAVWACASGLAMGFGLYSYLGARVSVLSLAAVVMVDWLMARDLASRDRLLAFGAGIALAALPLLFGYFEAPESVWLRASEVSIFTQSNPLGLFFENAAAHAGMFHWVGGAYARDNVPGLPMLDGVTGMLMLIGLWVLVRRDWRGAGWLVVLLLGINGFAGLLSVSQEGPPYVYRTAAVMLPTFLIVGFGVEAIHRFGRLSWRRLLVPASLAAALVWNLHLYFGLEARNVLAARVMAYELRLVADEVRATELPVYLVGADTLAKRQVFDGGAEGRLPPPPYLDRNPTFRFSTGYALRAVELLSGRRRELGTPDHGAGARSGSGGSGIEMLAVEGFARARLVTPAVLLFQPGGEAERSIRRRFPAGVIRYVEDVRGSLGLAVATVGKGAE